MGFCKFLDNFSISIKKYWIFCKFLDLDFRSQHLLFVFCASKLASKCAKRAGNTNFGFKNAPKEQISEKSQKALATLKSTV